ncbi:serine/threonine-protein kinase [Dactylosporangium cerinum]|uniref:non-specific serine/threonine protein kinase n=1 Tax=Dactylosporangium cerinum TaxID=1434730 RepID=A0ABV9WB78_9ACTN
MTVHRFTDTDGVEWTYDDQDKIGDPSGMGTVFTGASPDGTPVAVKRVRLPYPSLSAERRRDREVQIGKLLVRTERSGNETSHLVLPLGYQFVGEDLYIVMPLADESLGHALKLGPFGLPTGVDIMRQVAVGLEQLAAVSIVHRDLKPDNVLRYGATWRITDFGLSKNLSEGTVTVSLAGWGTDPYTAPELWNNQPATPRSDLYALGVLAFEVFTGARPFPGPRGEYRRQHQQDPPPDLPDLPPRLARLTLRLLAKNPAERPQDARAVVEAIDAYALRLRPNQEALVDAALELEHARANGEAGDAVAMARAEQVKALRLLAATDLGNVLANAYDDVREALPDARIDRAALEILVGGLRIAFETSEPLHLSAIADPGSAVLTGVVRLVPADGPRQLGKVFAHLTYAPELDGRFRWDYTGAEPTDTDRRPLDDEAILTVVRTVLAAAARGGNTRPAPWRTGG